jgi:flavin-dependent dehydrogenase
LSVAGGAGAPERVDAVVVGARPAGSAVAATLARAGRRVVALDRAHFPSDTLSTHLLFAGGVAELARIGALERVEEVGAPRLPEALLVGAGVKVRARYTPVDGIDYGMCVRRVGLDAALVETARATGAEVRERARVTELVWDEGRVAGVRYEDEQKRLREVRAPLVVGADGRRSTVARAVGALTPHRWNRNGRACFYAYLEDTRPEWRGTAAQWREGQELGTAFPCDDGLLLALLMPPVERADELRADLDHGWDRTVASIPGLRERLEGCRRVSKVRSAIDTTSYFRRSSGPGWALPGDAGHFKDPVTAQGIRDAVRFGRLLGEAAAPVLEDRLGLDRALARWERRRDRECIETYAWTNSLGRAASMTPVEEELYRAAARDPELATRVLDVFSRTQMPTRAVPMRLGLTLAVRALRRREKDPRAVRRAVADEVRDAISMRAQRVRARSRRPAALAPVRPGRPVSEGDRLAAGQSAHQLDAPAVAQPYVHD